MTLCRKYKSDQSLTFEFRTFINQRGIDHSSAAVDQVVFGPEFGNMTGASYTEDWTNESNFIYAGGQGEGYARIVSEFYDLYRYIVSLPGPARAVRGLPRVGYWLRYRLKANAALAEGQPATTFSRHAAIHA